MYRHFLHVLFVDTLPVSTLPNAIAFGSGLLQTRDMFNSGMLITVFALVATILTSIFIFRCFSD